MAYGDFGKPFEVQVREGVAKAEKFVSGANLGSVIKPRVICDWGWLKLETHIHHTHGEEYHLTVKLPFRRRVFYSATWNSYARGRPSLFVAFGRVQVLQRGWHARAAIQHLPADAVPLSFVESLAYGRKARGVKP